MLAQVAQRIEELLTLCFENYFMLRWGLLCESLAALLEMLYGLAPQDGSKSSHDFALCLLCSEDAANGMMEGALAIRGQIPPVLLPAVRLFGELAAALGAFLFCGGCSCGSCIADRKKN